MEMVASPPYSNAARYTRHGPSINYPPSKSTLEIHLPLRIPKQMDRTPISTQLIKPTSDHSSYSSWRKKTRNTNTNSIANTIPTCTTSDILRLMDSLGLPIPLETYTSLIKECTIAGNSTRANQLHAHINQSRLKPSLPLLNRLLLMHVSCSHVDTARQLFDRMSLKDFHSWAIMIVGYVEVGNCEEAIALFARMERQQHHLLEFPSWIIVCILKACLCTMNMGLGKQVHALLLKLGRSTNDYTLTGSLISFYGKFGCLEGVNFVFDQLLRHNTLVWTAKMVSSCREGHFHEVVNDFKEMGRTGIKKNSFTISSVLRACGGMDDYGQCGRQIHANAIKLGLDSDVFVQCGLVDMYGKSGLMGDAKRVFEMTGDHKRNIACWNAMLMGYVRNGYCVEAIKFLYYMKLAGMDVEESLINKVRMACGCNTFETRNENMGRMYA